MKNKTNTLPRCRLGGYLCLLWLWMFSSSQAAPLAYTDMNVLELGVGVPTRTAPLTWLDEQWRLSWSADVSNTAHLERSGQTERLVLDMETQRRQLSLQYGKTTWLWQLGVEYIEHSGGSLDGFIDNFHQALGFPDGVRPRFKRNNQRLDYQVNGNYRRYIDDIQEGYGLLRMGLNNRWYYNDTVSISSGVQWSTPMYPVTEKRGHADSLLGMGSTDVSAWVYGQHAFAQHWSQYGALGGVYQLSAIGDLAKQIRKPWVPFAQYGLSWQVNQTVELNAQLQWQAAAFDSALTAFSSTTAAVLGGRLHLPNAWFVDIGVTEDVDVLTAPDVVFHVSISKDLRF